ncbi:MAG: hypothetical protein RL344_498 [Pseudomonadota bacterium]|jgi:hypothetical protein
MKKIISTILAATFMISMTTGVAYAAAEYRVFKYDTTKLNKIKITKSKPSTCSTSGMVCSTKLFEDIR